VLDGADSAALVWLNGRWLGAAKDSRLPSEWELTHLLQPTGNTLAVQVRPRDIALYDQMIGSTSLLFDHFLKCRLQ